MNFPDMGLSDPSFRTVLESAIVWSAATIGLYVCAKVLYRSRPRWWTTPIIVTPLLLITVILFSHTSYGDYIRGTHWLVTLLGPAIVSFAVPIYERRALIRRHWPALAAGVLVGSTTAMVSAWTLAGMLGVGGVLRLSLLPRSVSTPFAMIISGEIGGIPELTALFVILTGVFGAVLGEAILYRLPLRSVLARGAMFGMGAHVIGSAKAHQIDGEVGSIAGLVMVLAGITNVLAAPMIAHFLK